MGIKSFFLDETGDLKRYLRRYEDGPCPKQPYPGSYHNAQAYMDTVQHPANTTITLDDKDGAPPDDDPRWPTHCECGYELKKESPHQVFVERVYKRRDTGEEMILRDAPPGAIYNSWWNPPMWSGKDGLSLTARCPDGHDWPIDGKASNCTMPEDQNHRCWIRHNSNGAITVDKGPSGDNADSTCAAGGGSIQTKNWHGFLRNGEFVT